MIINTSLHDLGRDPKNIYTPSYQTHSLQAGICETSSAGGQIQFPTNSNTKANIFW